MTLRQFQYLLAVAEAGSFTKAAERLHVAQPSLSQQVQALEAEVGGRLLDRPPRPVRLTAAGRAFAAQARVAIASADRAVAEARRAIEGEPRTLSIITVSSLAVAMLPSCISRWRENHPDVTLTLHEYSHRRDVEEAVRSGHGDVGIGPAPARWQGAVQAFGWDELVVVVGESDPLAAQGTVTLESLADRDWVLFEEGHGLSEQVTAACQAAGFEPKAAVRTAQVEAATRLAAMGLGPALVPQKNVPDELRARVLRLDPPPVWQVAVYALDERFRPLVREFADIVEESGWQREVPAHARVLPTD
jgi:DNA-binding transcriptional LysR family regulator